MAADFADDEFVREDENDFDVIIIGAGLAGLTCAYDILKKKAGLDVLIIEKTGEVGGRALSKVYSETFHANLLQQHITDLLKALNINIDQGENIDTRKRMLYTKYGPSNNLPRCYAAEVHYFLQTIEEHALTPKFSTYTSYEEAEDLAETSVEQLLRKIVCLPYARSLCRAFICSTCAMRNLNDISALWLLVMLSGALGLFNRLKITIGDNKRYFIQGGATKIAQELLRKILRHNGAIKYAETVNKIKFNDDRVYVITERNYFRCEYVVIAVPPPMHNLIIIEPSSQLYTQPLYTSTKNVFFNAVYKNPFRNDGPVKDIISTWDSSSNLNIAYDATRSGSERLVLAGFLAEPNSTQTNDKDLFNTLNECFETTEASKYLQYREHNSFSLDDETKAGCPMSVMRPTSINNHISCTGAAFGRISFASSEYASNWPGTIDGAIEAGETAAYSILSKIRPQALTFHEITSISSKKGIREEPAPFKICAIQYLGLMLNVAVFLHFLKIAYIK